MEKQKCCNCEKEFIPDDDFDIYCSEACKDADEEYYNSYRDEIKDEC